MNARKPRTILLTVSTVITLYGGSVAVTGGPPADALAAPAPAVHAPVGVAVPVPDWRPGFDRAYALADGEVLKRVPAPFVPERQAFWGTAHRRADGRPAELFPADRITVEWDAAAGPRWTSIRPVEHTLGSVLTYAVGLRPDEVAADVPADLPLPGDWVVRRGATRAAKLEALGRLLSPRFDKPVRFATTRSAVNALVVRGAYRPARLPGVDDDEVRFVSWSDRPGQGVPFGRRGPVADLLRRAASFVGRPVVSEATGTDAVVAWREYEVEDAAALLRTLAAQTSLRFTVEPREQEVWSLVDAGAPAGPSARQQSPASRPSPATGPAAAPARVAADLPTRPLSAVLADLAGCLAAVDRALPSVEPLYDPAERRQAAVAGAVTLLRRAVAVAAELRRYDEPRPKQMADALELRVLPALVVLGDAEAATRIHAQAADRDAGAVAEGRRAVGRACELAVRWLGARGDEAAQDKLLAEATAMAEAGPTDLAAAAPLKLIATDPRAGKHRDSAITTLARLQEASRKVAGRAVGPQAFEGQPVVVEGTLRDGRPFSSAGWKGKVVLVEFWATWCGPCKAEMLRLAQAYARHHAAGLEVVGVSCDADPERLDAYLRANPGLTWPQLSDPAGAAADGLHPLAKRFGIEGIPVMLLIDKRGVLRSAGARANLETLIPELLAE